MRNVLLIFHNPLYYTYDLLNSASLILHVTKNSDYDKEEMLRQYCSEGNIAEVFKCISERVDVNACNKINRMFVSISAVVETPSVSTSPVDFARRVRRASLTIGPPPSRRTPLHWAVTRGHKDVVRLLVAAGADATLTNAKGDVADLDNMGSDMG